MSNTLYIVQIVISILLIILVLIQRAQTDTSGMFGGESASFLHTRRGAERFLFFFTIIIAVVFTGINLARVFIG